MHESRRLKLLFIINPNSGKTEVDYESIIKKHRCSEVSDVIVFLLPKDCNQENLKAEIQKATPDKVIAVGGDGTLKLVAEAVLPLQKSLPIGILPGGSANGMAKELGVPVGINEALDVIIDGRIKKIHLTKINDNVCIHLSDIGFNALVIKKFETFEKRGMWTYIKAAWNTLKVYKKMRVQLEVDKKNIVREAAMVVVANATQYGTGVLINPEGTLEDDLFEVVIVKQISFLEIFKMRFTHQPYHPKKTELLQTRSLKIKSRYKVHFQVDGEYLGKIKNISAEIMPQALQIVVPKDRL